MIRIIFITVILILIGIFFSLTRNNSNDLPQINFEGNQVYQQLVDQKQWQQLQEILTTEGGSRELTPQEKFYWAILQFELGQPHEALITVENILTEDFNQPKIRQLKAQCLLALRKFEASERWSRHWLKEDSKNPEALYLLALSLILRPDPEDSVDVDRYREGLSLLHQALKNGVSKSDDAHQLLADTYMFLGIELRDRQELSEAIGYMHTAVRLDPENGSFHYTLGELYLKLKRWPEALDELDLAHTHGVGGGQKLTRLLDDLCTTYHELAVVALLEERYEDAIDLSQSGLPWAAGKIAETRLNQLWQLAEKKFVQATRQQAQKLSGKESLASWRKILLHHPKDPEARWYLAQGLEDHLREPIEQDILQTSWGLEARLHLSKRLWSEGRREQSITYLIESWMLASGEKKLLIEENLFESLKTCEVMPLKNPWKDVWRMLHEGEKSDQWPVLKDKVKKYLKERYYVWLYFADVHLKRGETDKAGKLLQELESLDPPQRSWSLFVDLKKQLKEQKVK